MSSLTVSELFAEYQDSAVHCGQKSASWRRSVNLTHRQLCGFEKPGQAQKKLRRMRLDRVRPSHLEDAFSELREQQKVARNSGQILGPAMTVTKRVFSWAEREGPVIRSPRWTGHKSLFRRVYRRSYLVAPLLCEQTSADRANPGASGRGV